MNFAHFAHAQVNGLGVTRVAAQRDRKNFDKGEETGWASHFDRTANRNRLPIHTNSVKNFHLLLTKET
jgi:hypothetical protein